MAVKNLRTPATTKPQNGTAGNRVVQFIDAKNRSHNAIVLAAGSASGLKLYMSHYSPGNQVIDNVPAMVAATDVSCYVART